MAFIFLTNDSFTKKKAYNKLPKIKSLNDHNLLDIVVDETLCYDGTEFLEYYGSGYTRAILTGDPNYAQFISNPIAPKEEIKNDIKYLHMCLRTADTLTVWVEIVRLELDECYIYGENGKYFIGDKIISDYAKYVYADNGYYVACKTEEHAVGKYCIGIIMFCTRNIYGYYCGNSNNFKCIALRKIIKDHTGKARDIFPYSKYIPYKDYISKTKIYPYKVDEIDMDKVYLRPAVFSKDKHDFRFGYFKYKGEEI